MSIESEILRIQHNIADAYAAVADKGGSVPIQPNSENLAAAVASIPADGGSSSGEIYSTEETRIGTWIDGSPLYRKAYMLTTPAAAGGYKEYFKLDFSYAAIKNIYGYVKAASGAALSVNHSGFITYVNADCIAVLFDNEDLAGQEFCVVLEYAKAANESVS